MAGRISESPTFVTSSLPVTYVYRIEDSCKKLHIDFGLMFDSGNVLNAQMGCRIFEYPGAASLNDGVQLSFNPGSIRPKYRHLCVEPLYVEFDHDLRGIALQFYTLPTYVPPGPVTIEFSINAD